MKVYYFDSSLATCGDQKKIKTKKPTKRTQISFEEMVMAEILNALILSLLAGLSTGLGGLIVIVRKPSKREMSFLMGLAAIAIPLMFFLIVQFPDDKLQFTLVGIVGLVSLILGWVMTNREKKESQNNIDKVMENLEDMIKEMKESNTNIRTLIDEIRHN